MRAPSSIADVSTPVDGADITADTTADFAPLALATRPPCDVEASSDFSTGWTDGISSLGGRTWSVADLPLPTSTPLAGPVLYADSLEADYIPINAPRDQRASEEEAEYIPVTAPKDQRASVEDAGRSHTPTPTEWPTATEWGGRGVKRAAACLDGEEANGERKRAAACVDGENANGERDSILRIVTTRSLVCRPGLPCLAVCCPSSPSLPS